MKIKICNTNNRSFKQLSDYEEDKEARKNDRKMYGRNRQI